MNTSMTVSKLEPSSSAGEISSILWILQLKLASFQANLESYAEMEMVKKMRYEERERESTAVEHKYENTKFLLEKIESFSKVESLKAESENKQYKNEVAKLQETIAKLENRIAELEIQCKVSEEALQKWMLRNQYKADSRLDNHKKARDSSITVVDAYVEKIQKIQAKVDSMEALQSQLLKEAKESQRNNLVLMDELEKVKSVNETSSQLLKGYTKSLSGKRARILELETELHSLKIQSKAHIKQ